LRKSPEKFDIRVVPFKVTRYHWNRHGSIGNLRLPISDP